MATDYANDSEDGKTDFVWQMEYYCPYPNIRVSFTVIAKTFEDAIIKGDASISNMRRTGTWKVRALPSYTQGNP